MENNIECVCRKYRVQHGTTIVEIESDKPLSTQLNDRLLQEEKEIYEFFKHHKILGTRQIIRPPPNQLRTTNIETPKTLTKRQRLSQLLQMKGEFTRVDYVKFLEDNFRNKLDKSTAYYDMQDMLKLNKIQIIAERKGKTGRKYKVIDTQEIEEPIYKKLLEDRKLHIRTLVG